MAKKKKKKTIKVSPKLDVRALRALDEAGLHGGSLMGFFAICMPHVSEDRAVALTNAILENRRRK